MNIPLRVVVINDSSVAKGGATKLALLLAIRMAARGVSVRFVCGDAGCPSLQRAGIEVDALCQQPIASTRSAGAAVYGLHNMSAKALVAKLVAKDDGQTIYHVHGWSKILSPAIFDPLADVASRVVIHAHDYFLACPNGAYMDYQAGISCIRKPLGKDCLTTHCDKRNFPQKLWRTVRQVNVRRVLSRSISSATVVAIHNDMWGNLIRGGLMNPPMTLRNPATAWCSQRVRVEDNSTLFFVGQLTAEKGIDIALKAVLQLGEKIEVIGNGPLLASLESAYPSVRFHRQLTSNEIAVQIRRARALIVPSRYPEPFGLVIAEALLSGIPVVLPSTALLSKDVAQYQIGIVHEPGSFKALVAALHEIMSLDATSIKSMSQKAVESRGLALSEDEWITGNLELYSTLLSRKNRKVSETSLSL